MRVDTPPAVPAFQPITITLENADEARALKVLCTTTAKDAVLRKPGLAVSSRAVHNLADSVFRALKAKGVSYLSKNV